MKKYKLHIAMILIFIFGLLIGSLGTGIYIHSKIKEFITGDQAVKKVFFMKFLDRKLCLSKKQHVEIEKIVDKTHADMLKVKAKFVPELKKNIDANIPNLKKHLDNPQKEKLDKMYEVLKKNWNLK